MTDAQLVQDYCDGDIQAFNRLVERWQDRIHRLAYRYFASHDEAMEITQKTFIKVYNHLHSLDDAQKFPAWIYRIANNLCLDESRRAGRRKATSLEAAPAGRITNSLAANPAHKLDNKELGTLLQQALNKLPYEQRIVVILKEYEELTFREIAEILEEPENTIKSRMYYGLNKLRGIFDKWNLNMEELNYES